MTKTEIELLIIGFIAADEGVEAADLLVELTGRGEQLPVDSIVAVEVLGRVEEATGVELPMNAETARALRSVTTFAAAVWERLQREYEGSASA